MDTPKLEMPSGQPPPPTYVQEGLGPYLPKTNLIFISSLSSLPLSFQTLVCSLHYGRLYLWLDPQLGTDWTDSPTLLSPGE